MSLFAENADVKEKFYSFKNHAIEDLNKKRGKSFIIITAIFFLLEIAQIVLFLAPCFRALVQFSLFNNVVLHGRKIMSIFLHFSKHYHTLSMNEMNE